MRRVLAGRRRGFTTATRWDAILHLGLCESCDVPRAERLAQDYINMRIPDNQGRQIHNAPLDGKGHRGCWLDLTLWDPDRFPVAFTVSSDAGAYLCNETYLHHESGVRTSFNRARSSSRAVPSSSRAAQVFRRRGH